MIIHVEGNIGSGKTTLIDNLEKFTSTHSELQDRLLFVREPLDKWQNLQGKNILADYYQSPKEYSFCLNTFILNTLIDRRKHFLTYSSCDYAVFERSCESTPKVFVPYARESGEMSDYEHYIFYHNYENLWNSSLNACDRYIFIDCPPAMCYERIISRTGVESSSSKLNKQFLQRLETIYYNWLNYQPDICIIDGTQSQQFVLNSAIDHIITTRNIHEFRKSIIV